MKICKTCNLEKPLSDFPKYYGKKDRVFSHRPHCKICSYKKEREGRSAETKEKLKQYHRQYHRKNPLNAKVKAYQHADKKRCVPTISLQEARTLIERNDCSYCQETRKEVLGLDRIDNSKGHAPDNVVVCCEKCNFILGDLPIEVKIEFRQCLRKIKEKELLETWTIPTKRRKSLGGR